MFVSTYQLNLKIREESCLSKFENRVPRRIFGPKRDDNREQEKFHNKQLLPWDFSLVDKYPGMYGLGFFRV